MKVDFKSIQWHFYMIFFFLQEGQLLNFLSDSISFFSLCLCRFAWPEVYSILKFMFSVYFIFL